MIPTTRGYTAQVRHQIARKAHERLVAIAGIAVAAPALIRHIDEVLLDFVIGHGGFDSHLLHPVCIFEIITRVEDPVCKVKVLLVDAVLLKVLENLLLALRLRR